MTDDAAAPFVLIGEMATQMGNAIADLHTNAWSEIALLGGDK